jgi:hypothetical protein
MKPNWAALIIFLVLIGLFIFKETYLESHRSSRQPPKTNAQKVAAPKENAPNDPLDASATAKPVQNDPVVAIVNGEAIRESDITVQLPKGAFGISQEEARQAKIQRMIDAICIRQFLQQQKIDVTDAEIDAEVEALRKNPPTAGCACCRYQSLEQYMQANFMDMKELRLLIANSMGFEKYLSNLWDKEYPSGEKRTKLLEDERARLAKHYVRVSHIFFNTFQDPDFENNPDRVRQKAGKKAEVAVARLKKGEAFETLARELSDDAISGPQGGELGCIPVDAFGLSFAAAVSELKTGQYSKPVESPWGYHVIRREDMKDEDYLAVLKDEFVNTQREDVLNNIHASAKIELPGTTQQPEITRE